MLIITFALKYESRKNSGKTSKAASDTTSSSKSKDPNDEDQNEDKDDDNDQSPSHKKKPIISKKQMKDLLEKNGEEMFEKLKKFANQYDRGTSFWKNRDFRVDPASIKSGVRTWNLQVNKIQVLKLQRIC
jgi:hypothetical protein